MSKHHGLGGNEDSHSPGCGTCTDFKDWLASSKEKSSSSSPKKPTAVVKEKQLEPPFDQCPLFRDQLGRCTWGLLHTISVNYPKNPTKEEQEKMESFIDGVATFFPCRDCAEDFQEEYVSILAKQCNKQKTYDYPRAFLLRLLYSCSFFFFNSIFQTHGNYYIFSLLINF